MTPRRDRSDVEEEGTVPDIKPDELEVEPGDPEILESRTEYLGTLGEQALELVRVWLIVPEGTPEEAVQSQKAREIQRQIGEWLRNHNPEWIPSIRFRSKSQYEEDTGKQL